MMNDTYLFDWGDTLMKILPEFTGKMCEWINVETTMFAKEALEAISREATIYIATAAEDSTPEEIAHAFRRVGLDKFITGYFCKQNTGFTKPDPEFYLAIVNSLGANPGSVTMVGDSLENDILPCHLLGFNAIWLHSGSAVDVPEEVRIISNLSELYLDA